MTDLSSLIERTKLATGPDRELDRAIHRHLFPPPQTIEDVELPPGFGQDALSISLDPTPAYTSSIDAIVALIERELPHACWEIRHGFLCKATVWFLETDYEDRPIPTWSTENSPALALCAAFLMAKAASTKPDAKGKDG